MVVYIGKADVIPRAALVLMISLLNTITYHKPSGNQEIPITQVDSRTNLESALAIALTSWSGDQVERIEENCTGNDNSHNA